MRKILCCLMLVLLVSVVMAGKKSKKEAYGEGLSLSKNTPIARILKSPEKFEGKKVRVAGKVEAVCEKMGCWMDLATKKGQKIQIKVQDGVIVFPTSAVGKNAIAEGEVEILRPSKEEYLEWRKHQAEEQGKAFDEASIGDPPYTIVRVRGEGAEIR